jgi:hypothetical protein
MIKYKATDYDTPTIAAVEVVGETDKMVIVPTRGASRKEKKETNYVFYADTFEDAKAWLVRNYEREVSAARRALEYANSKLGNVKGLKDPTEQPTYAPPGDL